MPSIDSDFHLGIMTGWTSKLLESPDRVWSFLIASHATFALKAESNLRLVTLLSFGTALKNLNYPRGLKIGDYYNPDQRYLSEHFSSVEQYGS
jgi:hypothetical protein